jgi:Trk-type K+ transport system membrane component
VYGAKKCACNALNITEKTLITMMNKIKQFIADYSKYLLFFEMLGAFLLGAYLVFFPENLWHVFVRGIGILFFVEGIGVFKEWYKA